MGTLVIVRHAKSDWDTGKSDHERPLNARGRREAPLLGAELRQRGFQPDLALCSDAVRARETCELAVRAFRGKVPTRLDGRLYDASRSEILEVVQETSDEIATLAVIGHEPASSALAALLAGEAEPSAARLLTAGLRTACAAVLTFTGPWAQLEPGSARLEAVVMQPRPST